LLLPLLAGIALIPEVFFKNPFFLSSISEKPFIFNINFLSNQGNYLFRYHGFRAAIMRRARFSERCLIISYLRCARKFFSNRELAEALEIPEPVLSRYVTGNSLPNEKNTKKLLEKIKKLKLIKKILDLKIEVDKEGLVNLTSIAFDPLFLRMASINAYLEFKNLNVDSVITAAVNGVPLATLVSEILHTGLCIAKREIDVGEKEYYSVDVVYPPPSPRRINFHIPHRLLSGKKRVLVVDDLLYSGKTLDAITRLAEKAGSRVVGLYTLVAVGDSWKEKIPETLEKLVVVKFI